MKKLCAFIIVLFVLNALPVNAQWQQTQLSCAFISSFAISGNNIFAGSAGGSGVYLSSNNGSSWTCLNNGLPNEAIRALAISGSNIFAGTDVGMYLSTNNGSSWDAISNGLPANTRVLSIAISGSNVFAGTNNQGVFLSINGSSWTAINNGFTSTNVNALAISGSSIFAGTIDGVFLSIDNGNSWTSVSDGLIDPNIVSLTISGIYIFASTYKYDGGCVWKRPLSELIGIQENTFNSNIRIFPNPAANFITIENPSKENATLEISNSIGQVVYKTQISSSENTKELDVSAFPSGIYFVKIKSRSDVAVQKFVKQ